MRLNANFRPDSVWEPQLVILYDKHRSEYQKSRGWAKAITGIYEVPTEFLTFDVNLTFNIYFYSVLIRWKMPFANLKLVRLCILLKFTGLINWTCWLLSLVYSTACPLNTVSPALMISSMLGLRFDDFELIVEHPIGTIKWAATHNRIIDL